MIDNYEQYLVELVRKKFYFGVSRERFYNNSKIQDEFNILAHYDKGILVTAESINGFKGQIGISKLYFEISTLIDGEAVTGDRADAFIDLLIYDHIKCRSRDDKNAGLLFCYDVVKHGLENILNKLDNELL